MVKNLFVILFLALSSHALMAGEKAKEALGHYGFNQAEISVLETKYPELSTLELASDIQNIPDEKKPLAFTLKLYSENTNDVYIVQKNDTQVDVEKTYLPFEIVSKTIEGEIHGTLFDTLKREVGSEKIANQLSDAFSEDFTTTKGLRVKAYYSFEVIEYFDQNRFVKYGDVRKASLTIGQAISKKVLQQDFKTLAWSLQPEFLERFERPFYAPVKSSRVSSLFQLNRRHPVTKRHQPHNGIDFVASSGTAVYPAMDGEVVTMGRARSKGKFIVIKHDNGYQTTYDHLRKFKKGLRVGMHVEMDDQIGEVGRTGYATGAHLHFGVINEEGFYVNPIYLVRSYCYDQKDRYENFTQESEDQVAVSEDAPTNDTAED